MLPTLDTPIPAGKNAVWHVGTPLAWKQMRQKLQMFTPQSDGRDAAGRLARSLASPADVDPRSLLLEFGRLDQGVQERIRGLLRKRFPGNQPTILPEAGEGFFSYAFLALGVNFTFPYHDQADGLTFRGADGRPVRVRAFGLGDNEKHVYLALRRQVRVLYHRMRYDPRYSAEFAIDLDRRSTPYQIVLAVMPRPPTLEAAYRRSIESAIAEERYRRTAKRRIPWGDLEEASTLIIPNQDWDIVHRHRELERGPTLSFFSRIRFRLDRTGARLLTEAREDALCSAPDLWFDRPFLLYVRHRRASRPCFAMWIENSELLRPLPRQGNLLADALYLPPAADDYHPVPRIAPPIDPALPARPAPLVRTAPPGGQGRPVTPDRARVTLARSGWVDGNLEAPIVRHVINGELHAIRQCYLLALRRNARLTGTVRFAFRVEADGVVSGTKVVSTLEDGLASECMERQVKALRFPSAQGATAVSWAISLH